MKSEHWKPGDQVRSTMDGTVYTLKSRRADHHRSGWRFECGSWEADSYLSRPEFYEYLGSGDTDDTGSLCVCPTRDLMTVGHRPSCKGYEPYQIPR